ncbi:MAG: hypothetical protein JEZ08_13015 [Clostridiales bacterium]|nr:hypothetical protein [Clostridiales bacterium]
MSVALKLKDVTWIGQAFEDTSILSPFEYIKEEGFTDEDKNRLVSTGVIKKDGSIEPKQVPLFNTLNLVDRYVNINVYEEMLSMKKSYLYAGPVSISMIPMMDELLFQLPSDHSQFRIALKNILGSSRINNLTFEVSLDAKVMKVFALICDMYREEAIQKQMEDVTLKSLSFDRERFESFVRENRTNRHRISKQIDVELEDLDACLKQLEEKKLIKLEENLYHVDESVLAFAYRYLLVDKVIVVEIGQLKGEKVYGSSFKIIQSGSNDVYVLENSTDAYTIATPSALEVQTVMNELIENGPSLID